MKPLRCIVIGSLGALLFIGSAGAKPHGFYLESLPLGSSVTLPRPATTYIGLNSRVTMSSTDLPQMVKLTPVDISGKKPGIIRIAITDAKTKKHKITQIKPDSPFLYNFPSRSAVSIMPVSKGNDGWRIKIESDKPLEISR